MLILSPVSFSGTDPPFAALGIAIAAGDPSPTAVLFGAQGATFKTFFVIDPTNGEADLINPSVSFGSSGLAFSPDGTLYGAKDALIKIDPATGVGTLVGPLGTRCADLAFAPDGTFYCIAPRPSALYTLDPGTGASTLIGFTGAEGLGSAMDVSPTGVIFLGTESGLFTLNRGTGAATPVATWALQEPLSSLTFCRPSAFDFDPSGILFGSFICGAGRSFLVTIDTSTAAVELVAETVFVLDGIAFGDRVLPLDGRIMDACTRGLLEGANVTLLKESPPGSNTFVASRSSDHIPLTQSQLTGADGTYRWSVVPGAYKVRAAKAGYVTGEGARLVIPPAATGVNVSISPIGGCPPTIAPIPNKTVDELTTLTFTANATDPDVPAQNLTFSLFGPAGAAINPATGLFTWTPTEAQGPGNFTFEVRVTDGTFTVSTPVHVTVREVNLPPTIAPIPNKTVDELTTLTFTANATDPDIPAQTLSFSLVGAPEGAAINPAMGLFTWTPTEAQGPGNYTFEVQVTDGTFNASTTVNIMVNDVETSASRAKAIGHGDLEKGIHFDFDVKSPDGVKFKGNLVYHDKTVDIKLDSDAITFFSVDATRTRARFGGVAKVNKVTGFAFQVDVEDNGKKGRNDFFSIKVQDPAGNPFYMREGNLTKGRIEVRIA